MTLRKLIPLTRTPQTRTEGDQPGDAGPSPVQQQAAMYGTIARKALEECKQGLSADQALDRRRNRSGQ
jgi:hypothetical protein